MAPLTLPVDRIVDILAREVWVFLRITGFMATAPVFSNAAAPARIRLVLALALTALVAPLANAHEVRFGFDGASVLAAANELLLGVAIGFTVQIAFDSLTLAGNLTALSMGMGFAALIDPAHHSEQPVVGQVYQIIAILLYLSMDGHLALLGTLAESFRWLPAGTGAVARDSLYGLAGLGARLIASGVVIALPAVIALLIMNVAMGLVSRAAPQLNLFAVGFPVTLMFGLLVLVQVMPALRGSLETLLREGMTQSAQLAGAR